MKLLMSLDAGTSKTVALVGEMDSYGDIHIIGIGETPSKGIDRGYITRLDLAVQTVTRSVKEAQEMAGTRVDNIIVGVASAGIKSQNEKDTISVAPQPVEIDESHIERLIERATTRAREEGYEIIAAIPRKFILDDQEGVIDPVGLLGSRLSAEVHVTKVHVSSLRNMEKVLHTAGLKIAGRYLSVLASAEAVLSQEEKEEGVLLLDMGAGLTSFILFVEGSPLLTGSVPMGGNSITKDIAHFMKITTEQAEKIKLEHGFALADLVSESDRIKIKPRGEEKETTVSKRSLSEVIQIRLEEIMDSVLQSVEYQGISLSSLHAGVVVTGGGAKLAGMREFLERYTDLPVRVGYPTGVIGLKERVQDPSYATAVGLIKMGFQDIERVKRSTSSPNVNKLQDSKKGFTSLLERIKSFFKEVL